MSQSFGTALRQLRKSTADPETGKSLTQVRLAELISFYLELDSGWPYPQTISDWERGKYQINAQSDRRVLLIIAEIFAELGTLRNTTAINAFFADGGYAPLSPAEQKHLFGKNGKIAAPVEQPVPPCPYRGLSAFQEADAPLFFGRETAEEQLYQRVFHAPLTTVFGASGSGKSSFVLAGLLPRLREEGNWLIGTFRPGNDPFHALGTVLMTLLEPKLSESACLIEGHALADALQSGELTLTNIINRILNKRTGATHVLLFVDQLEELFTLSADEPLQRRFLDCFIPTPGETATLPPFRTVATLRADFLAQALSYRPFADTLETGDIKLGPMNEDELRRVIEKPSHMRGVSFEPGLVERILADVRHEPGNLPLLQFALTELWELQEENALTHNAYEAIGTVRGALSRYADRIFERLSPTEQKQVHTIFVQLVHPGEKTGDTRRLATRTELGYSRWKLVQRLADARLVVTNRTADGAITVEIIHEALITHWERLREWMAADRAFRTWQEQLRTAIRQWERAKRDTGALLRGLPLAEAELWLEKRPQDISEAEKTFINDGILLRETERSARREQQQRELLAAQQLVDAERRRAELEARTAQRFRRRNWILIGVLALALIAAGSAVMLFSQARQATGRALSAAKAETTARQLANARALAAFALVENNQHTDPSASLPLLLAREAVQIYRRTDAPIPPEIDAALRETVDTASPWLMNLPPHRPAAGVRSLAFSPDGQTILSAGADSAILLWRVTDGMQQQQFLGHIGWVWDAVFSPDGRKIVSGGDDTTVRVWDVASGAELMVLRGHTDSVHAVAFSPDGTLIASTGADGTLRLWDAETGAAVRTLGAGDGWLWDVAFLPDGKTVAAAGDDGTIQFWRVADGAPVQKMVHAGGVRALAFTADGAKMVSAGWDGTARLWDVAGGAELHDFRGHTRGIWDVNFSADDSLLATAGADGTVRLWDMGDFSLRQPLIGHKNEVWAAVFSPDGQTLASGSWDTTIRMWNVSSGEQQRQIAGHIGEVTDAVFSADGSRIATAGIDARILVWNADSGAQLTELRGHSDTIHAIKFSPDGKKLVSASDDGTARVWNLATGAEILRLEGHTKGVWTAVFSADGQLILTSGADGTARLWDAETGKPVRQISTGGKSLYDAVFSADGGQFVTTGADGAVQLWNTETGALQNTFTGHSGNVWAAAFSPDGQTLLTAGADRTARLWNVATGAEIGQLAGHTADVRGVAFSPDGQTIFTAGADWTLRVWRTDTRENVRILRGHIGKVFSVAVSPNGQRLLSAGGDGFAKLWSTDPHFPQKIFTAKNDGFLSAKYSPDGQRILTVGRDGVVFVWNVNSGNRTRLGSGDTEFNAATFSPNGTWLATGEKNGDAILWDAQTLSPLKTMHGHSAEVWSVAFSPNGEKLVTASADKTARVWDVARGEALQTLAGHTNNVWSAAFSPDGTKIVTAAADATARLWSADDGKLLITFAGHGQGVRSAQFSPDGTKIVTASDDHSARVWDMQTGAELLRLDGHTDGVRSAQFSADGQRILTAGADHSVRIWNAPDGTLIRVLTGHTKWVWSAEYSADGQTILSAGDDETVRVWDATLDGLMTHALNEIQREPPIFLLKEREKFLSEQ